MGPAELYLDLLKRCLTRLAFLDQEWRPVAPRTGWGPHARLSRWLRARWAKTALMVMEHTRTDPQVRMQGRDWPPFAETMIGLLRLDNLQRCIETILRDRVPGDFIEAGIWRGGAVIFMLAALKAYGDQTRLVWAADSFKGVPHPDPRYPADAADQLWTLPFLAVSLDTVRQNFARYGLLDDRVKFLVGWFRDTLPSAPIGPLALIRLDGDLYESTMDSMVALYPKLSPGGYLIVDDFGAVPGCRQAIEDYRTAHHISEPIEPIDRDGVFWRRK